mgnify:CR=1 FL=1
MTLIYVRIMKANATLTLSVLHRAVQALLDVDWRSHVRLVITASAELQNNCHILLAPVGLRWIFGAPHEVGVV